MRIQARRAALVAASAVSIVVAFSPSPAQAAPTPTITSLSTTGGAFNGDDFVVTIHGTKLTAAKTVTLLDLSGGDNEPISIVSRAPDRIVVKLAHDLAAGSYRFLLATKSGGVVSRDYTYLDPRVTVGSRCAFGDANGFDNVTASVKMRASDAGGLLVERSDGVNLLDVTPSQTVVGNPLVAKGAITAQAGINVTGAAAVITSSTNRTQLGTGFAPAGGTALIGTFQTLSTAGGQLRFERTPSTEYFDIGQNGIGQFVLEKNDTTVLKVNAAGDLSVNVGDLEMVAGDIVVNVGNAFKPGGGSWATLSDARLKKDVQPLSGTLDTLLLLRSVSFEYTDPAAIHESPGRQIGFVAQEVEEVLPAWVGDRADGMKYVAPKGFESLAVQALRELRAEKDAQVKSLAEDNAALRARLAEQETRLARVEALLARADAAHEAPAEADAASRAR